MKDFPCTKCGACCEHIAAAIEVFPDFPYKTDQTGRCEMLDSDNNCKVYENRPLICNIAKLGRALGMGKQEFFRMNITMCNQLMDLYDKPQELRITDGFQKTNSD